MNSPLGIFVILTLLAAAIFTFIKMAKVATERERIRLLRLSQWAEQNGFAFSQSDPFNLDGRFNGIGEIGRGHDRYAYEILSRGDPIAIFIFRYHYKTWETRTVTENGRTYTQRYEATHHFNYLIAELAAQFPNLTLRNDSWMDKVAGFVGFDDIDFESEEFSKRYFCKSDDRQFAYAIIHPQMMEWLMARQFDAQLVGGLFLMSIHPSSLSAEGCQACDSDLAGFINRIPQFVWEDYGKRAPIQLPEPIPPPMLDPASASAVAT